MSLAVSSFDVIDHIPAGSASKIGVEFGSKLINILEEEKIVKLQCAFDFSIFKFGHTY